MDVVVIVLVYTPAQPVAEISEMSPIPEKIDKPELKIDWRRIKYYRISYQEFFLIYYVIKKQKIP